MRRSICAGSMHAILAGRTTDGAGSPALRPLEIGDCDIARPGLVFGAGDHGDPNESVDRKLAIGNHQRGTPLRGEPVGMGKRHHDDIGRPEPLSTTQPCVVNARGKLHAASRGHETQARRHIGRPLPAVTL